MKELEEEREQGLKDDEGHKSKSDLEDSNQYRSENDKSQNDQKETDKNGDAVVVLGGEPDPENHSVKESNSTGRKSDNDKVGGEEIKSELEQDRSGPGEDGPVSRASEPVGKESDSDSDSDKGSSDTVGKNPRVVESSEPSRRSKADESSELRDSAAQSKGETRESGEVQSSASLTRKRNGKRRRRKEASDGSSGGEEASEAHEEVSARSRPLFGLLQTVRTHQHGSLFERRLQSQVLVFNSHCCLTGLISIYLFYPILFFTFYTHNPMIIISSPVKRKKNIKKFFRGILPTKVSNNLGPLQSDKK